MEIKIGGLGVGGKGGRGSIVVKGGPLFESRVVELGSINEGRLKAGQDDERRGVDDCIRV